MENQEQNNPNSVPSMDKFSFLNDNVPFHKQDQEPDFEFGSITPSSPTSDQNKDHSPADLLFSNGVLLPHVFTDKSSSRTTTRTNSMSSRDSSYTWMTCRSNSTSSSRSSFSSTQTSSPSDLNHNPMSFLCHSSLNSNDIGSKKIGRPKNFSMEKQVPVRVRVYSTVQPRSSRWQFIRPAPPVLIATAELSRRRKIEPAGRINQKSKLKKEPKKKKRNGRMRSWFGWRILRSIVWACRTCHALEPAAR